MNRRHPKICFLLDFACLINLGDYDINYLLIISNLSVFIIVI